MEWDDLRYVLALARAGTLMGAARELNVVRTTVGRRLNAIEDALGVRLFDRTPQGFVPTVHGEDLAAVAAQIEAQVLAAECRVRGGDAELQGTLCVSTMDFVYEVFADVFSSFIARYPQVDLVISTSPEVVSLRRREADVVIRLSNDPPDYLVGRRMGRVEFGLYGSRELVERVGAGSPLGEFPWLSHRDGGLEGWRAQHAAGGRTVMHFDTYPVLRRAISAGVGVHFLACFDGERDAGLVDLGARLDGVARDLWVLTLAELRSNVRVRVFMDHVYKEMGERL